MFLNENDYYKTFKLFGKEFESRMNKRNILKKKTDSICLGFQMKRKYVHKTILKILRNFGIILYKFKY